MSLFAAIRRPVLAAALVLTVGSAVAVGAGPVLGEDGGGDDAAGTASAEPVRAGYPYPGISSVGLHR